MSPVAFSLHNALTRWEFSAFPIAVALTVVALAVWYLRADWHLAARGRRWSPWRTTAFLAGLVAVDLALQSPVAAMTGTYFQAHVVQHLLLMVVGPPLLALGAPSTLLLQTASRRVKQRWLAVLRSVPFAAISNPVVVWALYYGAMFVFFLTGLLNYAMLHMWLMDLINLGFLFGATLFWWPMVGIDPIIHWKMSYPARMLNILLGSGVEAFLGVAILNSHKPLASMYTLASTKTGGGLLWAATEVVTLGAFVPIFLQWMHSEQRVAARVDARGAGAVALVGGARGGAGASHDRVDGPGAGGNPADWPFLRRTTPPEASRHEVLPRGSLAPASVAARAAAQAARAEAPSPPEVAISDLTPWEYAWLARTGNVPSQFVVPDFAPDDGEAGAGD